MKTDERLPEVPGPQRDSDRNDWRWMRAVRAGGGLCPGCQEGVQR